MSFTTCHLCKSNSTEFYHKDKRRKYLYCDQCHLVFVPQKYHVSPAEEKKRYDLHQNSAKDSGYRRFLSRIFKPVNYRVNAESHGLDFGSGPGPTLSLMFEEAGHNMEIYDIYYANNKRILDKKYDFITASEVVEHLEDPLSVLDKLWACLNNGGCLGIMTKMVLNKDAFSRWHYITDLTHISFFSKSTFKWIGYHFQSPPEFIGKDVVIFEKES